MMNTGTKPVTSTHGLLTTIAYQIGIDGPVHYALEGSVAFSGSTIQWLRDQLEIISDANESESLASTTSQNDGLYFVPAFSGLLAPYWQSDARGCIVGMCSSHHKGHICRAALEATAYQTKSIFDAMTADEGIQLQQLNVDGGGTHNNLLMQFQADMINVPVIKPVVMETTSLGAAFAAGLAVGIWKDMNEIQQLYSVAKTYQPTMSNEIRDNNWKGWQKAIQRSFGWMNNDDIITTITNSSSSTSNGKDVTTSTTIEESTNSNLIATINQKQKQLEDICHQAGINATTSATTTTSLRPDTKEHSSQEAEPVITSTAAAVTTESEKTGITPTVTNSTNNNTVNVFVGEVYDLDDEQFEVEVPEEAKKRLSPQKMNHNNNNNNDKKNDITTVRQVLVGDNDIDDRNDSNKDRNTITGNKDDVVPAPSNMVGVTVLFMTAAAAMSIGFFIGANIRKR
jgi:FGGY family of carbohydrate kinases, C-terminal domain